MEGLGYLQQGIRGIIQHNVFLVNELGLPLGILDQQYWTRQGGLPFKGDKGSQKWFNGLEAVNEHLDEQFNYKGASGNRNYPCYSGWSSAGVSK